MKILFYISMLALIVVVVMLMCGYFDFIDPQPVCTSKKGEEIMRHALREMYGQPFAKAHPKWLRNPETGRCLELDCYNATLGIAAEYNGEQHYKYPNTFHKSQEAFEAQVRRDEFKKKKCKEHGVLLIIIPYTVPKDEIKDYLKRKIPTT